MSKEPEMQTPPPQTHVNLAVPMAELASRLLKDATFGNSDDRVIVKAVLRAIDGEIAQALSGSTPPPSTHVAGVSYEHIERLMHAVEGECDGLAIDSGQALAILSYVISGEATAPFEQEKDALCVGNSASCGSPSAARSAHPSSTSYTRSPADHLEGRIAELEQALAAEEARNAELVKRLDKARECKEPDFCYDPDEWEFTCDWDERDQVHGYGEALEGSEPMLVATLIRGPRKWVADVPITWDEHGDPDETEIKWFDSEEEARAALFARPEVSDNA